MKQILSFLIIFGLLVIECTKAQQVIATSGYFAQTGSGTLSYTLGELVIDTYTKNNTTLTQGFQQPKIVVTAINEISGLDFSITAFPNPTSNMVKLKIEKGNSEKTDYVLYDIGGKALLKGRLENGEADISFEPFLPAMYVLKIHIDGKEVKTFKIIKQ